VSFHPDPRPRAAIAGIAGIALGGTAVTWALAMAVGMTTADTVKLAAIAGASAAAAGIAGVVAVLLLRRSSVGVQAVVVALASTAALGTGAAVAARLMFLTAHDLDALAVILPSAATVGILFAVGLGLHVGRAVQSLRETTRRIGNGGRPGSGHRRAPAEFEALAREIEDMEARLQEGRRRERAVESSRRELVAWISHDLRTPLAAIRAMAEALEDGVVTDGDSVERYYRTLRVEADRLSGLVDDLFELSRINAGTMRLDISRVALSDLISDALAAASAVAGPKRIRLEGKMVAPCPDVPLSTPEMSRALRNLLENAIRHTPSDGAIWVEGGVDGDRAYVSVADECGGIPAEDLDRVFEMAFRGQAARTPEPDSGGGLGLAIARGIAEAHHGELSVRNEGLGCRFTLLLPLEQPG
jgi:signal transduction histidine kinase